MEHNKPLVSEKTSFSAIKRLWFLTFVLRSYLILPVVSREVFGAQSLSFFTLPVMIKSCLNQFLNGLKAGRFDSSPLLQTGFVSSDP